MSQDIKFCWVNITLVPAVKNNEMSSGWPSEIMQSAVQFELDAMMSWVTINPLILIMRLIVEEMESNAI